MPAATTGPAAASGSVLASATPGPPGLPSRWVAAPLAALLGALVALSAQAGAGPLLLCLLLAQALVALGWHDALETPGRLGGGAVGVVAGAAAGVLVWAVGPDADRPLAPVAAVLGLATAAGLVHQLVRRHPRRRTVASLAATVSLAALTALGALLVAARQAPEGLDAVTVGALATAAASLGWLVGRARLVVALGCGVLGVGTALLLGAGPLGLPAALALGLAATVATAAAAAATVSGRRPVPVAAVGIPVLLVGPATYLVTRLLAS